MVAALSLISDSCGSMGPARQSSGDESLEDSSAPQSRHVSKETTSGTSWRQLDEEEMALQGTHALGIWRGDRSIGTLSSRAVSVHFSGILFGHAPGDDGDVWGPDRPWGPYMRVPVAKVLCGNLAIAVQFAVYLSLVGWVSSWVRRPTLWVRGLTTICVPSWSAAIWATVAELVGGGSESYGHGVVSVVMFTLCCTFLASLSWELGFVSYVMGGVMVHLLALLFMSSFRQALMCNITRDSLKVQAYFFSMFCAVFLVAINGYVACLWWPYLAIRGGALAGPLLSVSSWGGESVCVAIVKLLDARYYRDVPYSRPMVSWAVMFIHSVSESFRLAVLWYTAIRNPSMEGKAWLCSLATSLALNTASRLGWVKYMIWWLSGSNFFVPSSINYVHREAQYAFGYGRFGAPGAVVGARYILGHAATLCFNEKVLVVWVGCFAAEAVEDCLVAFGELLGLEPPWYSEKSVQEFVTLINAKDPHSAKTAVTIGPGGQVSQKVYGREETFKSSLIPLGITTASTFMTYSAIVLLVSLDYLLGFSQEVHGSFHDLRNGGILWHAVEE